MAKPTDKSAPKQEEAPAASSAPAAAPISEELPPTAPDHGVAKTPKPADPVARFRVWPHGTLSHDGTVYQAGEELAFTEAEVAALNCPAIERF